MKGILALGSWLFICCAAAAAESPGTIDVGQTGFPAMRPVLASACPNGCPWGELGEFVQEAMAPLGFDVILCRNCNRDRGPRLVSTAGTPPALDRIDAITGTTERFDAPVDFGITASDNLAFAYKGTQGYADGGPYRNLRLIARIEDPRWVLVAATAESGITNLAQIAERASAVTILANPDRPVIKEILDYYGLSREFIEGQGGSFGRASFLATDAPFDVIIDTNGGPSNNPEAAYWTAYTQSRDLVFLDLPGELLNRLATDDYALERATAKWGLLRGVDRPIDTLVRNGHAIFARDDLPDDIAYAIAKAVYEHREALSTYIRPYSYVGNRAAQSYGVPLHPGARRFYHEMGFLEPACVPEFHLLPAGTGTEGTAVAVYHAGGVERPLPRNWVEEEYEFSCSALNTTYRTTLNVLRPRPARAFSGVVVVEPTHPGNLWPVRSTTHAYLLNEGHASVAVNSSAFVVERLVKPANPERYANLNVPDMSRLEDEMLHQVALALKGGGLPGISSPRVLLAGYSNTGAKVRRYIDHFRARYEDAYDGYLVGQTAVGTLPAPLPDLSVPVIDLEGEREIIATLERNPGGLTYRRPDSATFRLYEVPGMSHLDTSDPTHLSFPPAWCGIDQVSSFPVHQAWAATLDLLVRWVVNGTPAPHAPLIEMNADGVTIARDDHGNAKGGVPVTQIRVPAATMLTVGQPSEDHPRARCDMIGPQFDFDAGTLRSLYGDYPGYLRTLKGEMRTLARDGWVLPMYRDEIISAAEKVRNRF